MNKEAKIKFAKKNLERKNKKIEDDKKKVEDAKKEEKKWVSINLIFLA